MLTFLYPRMDYNVSTSQNHLLKLPFSIHPGSRKVSVPIFPNSVRDFDPHRRNIKFDNLIEELEDLSKKCKIYFI
jgi:DNA primase small subunit